MCLCMHELCVDMHELRMYEVRLHELWVQAMKAGEEETIWKKG